ncbi:MAG: radical SAM protein [Candidatus Omnitrophica bacterium]|nr:radical SAM protein [Candidatus Omnitrophota bacterium]
MLISLKGHSRSIIGKSKKISTLFLVFIFFTQSISWAESSTLSIEVGNYHVYEAMKSEMRGTLAINNGKTDLTKRQPFIEYIPEQYLAEATEILAHQDANVVLERNPDSGQWQFRRSSIPVELPKIVSELLGSVLGHEGRDRILISFRKNDPAKIRKALEEILKQEGRTLQSILADEKIDSFYEYKKVVLVPPYGDAEGRPLKNVMPSGGVEVLSYTLNRALKDVDSRVYNPNLTSPAELYDFLRREKPDVIAKGLLESTFKGDIEVLSSMYKASPDSLFFLGGPNMIFAPHQQLFDALNIDGMITGGAGTFVKCVDQVVPGDARQKNKERLSLLNNVVTVDVSGKVIPLKTGDEPVFTFSNSFADIPMGIVDVTHKKSYPTSKKIGTTPLARGQVGFRPLRVTEALVGNACKGKCIFCQLHGIGTISSQPPRLVVDKIKEMYNPGVHDCIYFGAWDIFHDLDYTRELARLLALDPVLKAIPKRASGRVDTIGDGSILDDLKRAGFGYISFGVETYNDPSLHGLGKQVTGGQNIKAIEKCIKSGIRPTVYEILLSKKETVETVREAIGLTCGYIERGASVSVVPSLCVFWGTPLSRMKKHHKAVEYYYDGMKGPVSHPKRVKFDDERLEKIENRMMAILEELLEDKRYPEFAGGSLNFYGLLEFKAFYLALMENSRPEEHREIAGEIKKIEDLIWQVLDEESETGGEGYFKELAPRYYHRKDLRISYDSEGNIIEDPMLLDDGTLVAIRRKSLETNIFVIYSVDQAEYVGEFTIDGVNEGKASITFDIPDVKDRTGALLQTIYEWAEGRWTEKWKGETGVRIFQKRSIFPSGRIVKHQTDHETARNSLLVESIEAVPDVTKAEIILGSGSLVQQYLAFKKLLGYTVTYYNKNKMSFYSMRKGKEKSLVLDPKDEEDASAMYWTMRQVRPDISVVMKDMNYSGFSAGMETLDIADNEQDIRIMLGTKKFIWDHIMFAVNKLDKSGALSERIGMAKNEIWSYLAGLSPYDISPRIVTAYLNEAMLACCATPRDKDIIRKAIKGIPFFRMFDSDRKLCEKKNIAWNKEDAGVSVRGGYSEAVEGVNMESLLSFWKDGGVDMHVTVPLGPVTNILDILTNEDEIVFSNTPVSDLKAAISGGEVSYLDEITVPQSSFGKRVYCAYHWGGGRTIIFSDLPGKGYNYHWQLMVKAYLRVKGISPNIKTIETQDGYEVNYTRFRDYFTAYAEHLRDVDTVIIAPPAMFLEEWSKYHVMTLDDKVRGVYSHIFIMPDGKKVAILGMRHSFHGEILGKNMKLLLEKYTDIKRVLFYQTAGFLGKFGGHYAVYPDKVLLEDGEAVENMLSPGRTAGFSHASVFSVLEETPERIREYLDKGVKSLDMELGYLAENIRGLDVDLGYGLVVVDSVTLDEGPENTGGWGDSYIAHDTESFASKAHKSIMDSSREGIGMAGREEGIDAAAAKLGGSTEKPFEDEPKDTTVERKRILTVVVTDDEARLSGVSGVGRYDMTGPGKMAERINSGDRAAEIIYAKSIEEAIARSKWGDDKRPWDNTFFFIEKAVSQKERAAFDKLRGEAFVWNLDIPDGSICGITPLGFLRFSVKFNEFLIKAIKGSSDLRMDELAKMMLANAGEEITPRSVAGVIKNVLKPIADNFAKYKSYKKLLEAYSGYFSFNLPAIKPANWEDVRKYLCILEQVYSAA